MLMELPLPHHHQINLQYIQVSYNINVIHITQISNPTAKYCNLARLIWNLTSFLCPYFYSSSRTFLEPFRPFTDMWYSRIFIFFVANMTEMPWSKNHWIWPCFLPVRICSFHFLDIIHFTRILVLLRLLGLMRTRIRWFQHWWYGLERTAKL